MTAWKPPQLQKSIGRAPGHALRRNNDVCRLPDMLPLTPSQLDEVTAKVGFALWQTQIAESTVGAYLVLVHKATLGQARTEVEGMFAKAGKSTLGQLLRSIQATGTAPQPLTDALDTFISKRNWLVHHSRHESRPQLYSTTGREALVSRLAAIADAALELSKAFQAATEAHLELLGISREQVDRDAARIFNEWITGD